MMKIKAKRAVKRKDQTPTHALILNAYYMAYLSWLSIIIMYPGEKHNKTFIWLRKVLTILGRL